MSDPHVVRNCLMFAYRALRMLERFVKRTHLSPYKDFFEKVLQRKLESEVPKSEVEAFYLGRQSEGDFVTIAENRLFGGAPSDPQLVQRLLSIVWDLQSATPTNSALCSGANNMRGFELWEIFVRLDTTSQMEVHIDDVCDIILRIFKDNGHIEEAANIREWFCGEADVGFWSFFRTMVENYGSLLQSPVVTELCSTVRTELLREGKLMKKGHLVHNWKGRYFILTTSYLTYYETKDGPSLKSIVINGNTQVQNMPETKGHQYRFRVLDGVSSTPTEISAGDETTMREWIAFVKLAIKMNQIDGRNFLHKYRVAMESFPKSFFSQSAAPVSFTSAPRQQGRKVQTSPAHMSLAGSKSVPLDKHFSKERGYRDNMPLPPVPSEDSEELKEHHSQSVDLIDSGSLNDPPPVPPQRFDVRETLDLTNVVRPTYQKQFTADKLQDGQATASKGHKNLRRHSSLELSEIQHIQVDGDLEYAVIVKAPKHDKKKKVRAPKRNCISPDPRMDRPLDIPPRLSPNKRLSPVLTEKSCPLEDATPPPPVPKVRTPSSSPTPARKGYIELEFGSGNVVAPTDRGQSMTGQSSDMPTDVKNKFGYTQLKFEGGKEKEAEFDRESSKSSGTKGLPPPVPKYRGNLMKSTTDTRIGNNQSPSPVPHSNGVSHSGSRPLSRSKPNSLPQLTKKEPGEREVAYAEVSFRNTSALSPSVDNRVVTTPDCNDSGPAAPRHDHSRVEYSSVVLTDSKKMQIKDEKDEKTTTQKPRSNYENFDLGPTSSKSGYENFDFGPSTGKNNEKKVVRDAYENCTPAKNGPVVSGSARLLKQTDKVVERKDSPAEKSPYVNTHRRPDSAPQPKPRVLPRKGALSPNQENSPRVPVRKTSDNTHLS